MANIELKRDIGGWLVRWNAELASRAVANGDWPNCSVADYARQRVEEHPDRVQIIDDGKEFSCIRLYEDAAKLAGYFQSIGLRQGEVISFQLPNWWEASVINLAAAMLGLVVNPIVPINRDKEVTQFLNESGSRVMFVPTLFRNFDYSAMMARLTPNLKRPPKVITVRDVNSEYESLESILSSHAPLEKLPDIDPNAVKLLMYTSGTTGRPKGVLHSHNTIHADSVKMKAELKLTENDVIFCPSPLTHVSGYLWVLNMPWLGDIPAVTVDTWVPARAYELMAKYRCSFMVGATPFLQDLVAQAGIDGPLADLKSYMCGGAAVPPKLIYDAAACFPNCWPWRTFGATEAPTLTAPPASRADLRLAAETDGRLCRVSAKVVNIQHGQIVMDGEEGEILVQEPSMALGYARTEDNEDSYDSDGYFKMGDLVKIVEGDHVLCTGRKKDIIIRSGENISAKEIEDVLYRSPKIKEAAVVAMPSVKTGDAICAFIVTDSGQQMDLAEVAELISSAGLAKQKTPEHVAVVDELPKNPAGKVRKDELRRWATNFSSE